MGRLPKIPRGLKRQVAKLERKVAHNKKVADRKRYIASLKSKRDSLRKKV